ncbi:unnamed protein product [Hyaloperonospora brassicae]|uniref:Uncharacterized protein n=1 Tax=Hyaloperonospora brassicae TaxID=162125 RepID=A0AAV0USW9_HYABA|nr:unnamed protein product [Hyaloperonospora brassicae]
MDTIASKVQFDIQTKAGTTGVRREAVQIGLSRFSGGTAQEYLQWTHEFRHIWTLKNWGREDAHLHLLVLLENEAREAYVDATAGVDIKDDDAYDLAYEMWARHFVPVDYSEQLEEEPFMFAKRRDETIALCYRRVRDLTRMMADLPSSAVTLSYEMLIRYFKRAMPSDWKLAYERSGIRPVTGHTLA